MGIKKVYADLVKTWNTGYGAGVGRFYGVINIILTASTFLIVKGFDLSFTQSIIFGLLLFVGIMLFGYFYIVMGFTKAEYSSNLKEQPEMIVLINDIKEIKDILKNQNKVV